MATPIKTRFAGGVNPFTGAKASASKYKPVMAKMISITDDPLPQRRVIESKYDPYFAKLRPGQSLRVPSEAVGTVAQGLRKWLARDRAPTVGRIKSSVKYDGDPGFGRVWLMPAKGGEK